MSLLCCYVIFFFAHTDHDLYIWSQCILRYIWLQRQVNDRRTGVGDGSNVIPSCILYMQFWRVGWNFGIIYITFRVFSILLEGVDADVEQAPKFNKSARVQVMLLGWLVVNIGGLPAGWVDWQRSAWPHELLLDLDSKNSIGVKWVDIWQYQAWVKLYV